MRTVRRVETQERRAVNVQHWRARRTQGSAGWRSAARSDIPRAAATSTGGAGWKLTHYQGTWERYTVFDGSTTVFNDRYAVGFGYRRVGPDLSGATAPDEFPEYQWYLQDMVGSITVVLDDSGDWVNREECSPYGETLMGSYARKLYRYNGKERDEETAFYYYGFRYYAPWLMRWTRTDPAGAVDGLNLYAYVGGRPVGSRDAVGLDEEADREKMIDHMNRYNLDPDWDISPMFASLNLVPTEHLRLLFDQDVTFYAVGHASKEHPDFLAALKDRLGANSHGAYSLTRRTIQYRQLQDTSLKPVHRDRLNDSGPIHLLVHEIGHAVFAALGERASGFSGPITKELSVPRRSLRTSDYDSVVQPIHDAFDFYRVRSLVVDADSRTPEGFADGNPFYAAYRNYEFAAELYATMLVGSESERARALVLAPEGVKALYTTVPHMPQDATRVNPLYFKQFRLPEAPSSFVIDTAHEVTRESN